ncbi:MAG: hypothetical protein QM564_06640 [Bergeyella sp.]
MIQLRCDEQKLAKVFLWYDKYVVIPKKNENTDSCCDLPLDDERLTVSWRMLFQWIALKQSASDFPKYEGQ